MKNTSRLKLLFEARQAKLIPGAPNGLFARVIEELGYEAVYVTGAGIANMNFGIPDIGLVSLKEVADVLTAIADCVNVPLLVDADTGFGNAVNVVRTVRMLERAGASGIQLEDQVFPKKCGHFSGKEIIPAAEMVGKIKAAADAREDSDLQIVARTDALAIEGVDRAIERAHAYAEAGADVTFVEAPVEEEQLLRIARELKVPQIANIVHGGRTPPVDRARLEEMGFAGVLYANAALQAALKGVSEVLATLRDEGTLSNVKDRLAGFDERQAMVRKDKFDRMEMRYRREEI